MIKKVHQSSLQEQLNTLKEAHLLCCCSFEERSLVVPQVAITVGMSGTCFVVLPKVDMVEQHAALMEKQSGFISMREIDRFDALGQWNAVRDTVSTLTGSVILDISSFTRELLAMLLYGLCLRSDHISKCTLTYVRAEEYATNISQPLSVGMVGVRTIIGYSGKFDPRKQKHLIALVGHEEDRLVEVIEAVEPNKLSLSNELFGTSTGATFHGFSEATKQKVKERIGPYESGTIDFSANDPWITLENLNHFADDHLEDNLILVGMNTKISFVAACLHSLLNRRMQLVYGVPLSYNTKAYSKSGEEITIFEIGDILKDSLLRLRSSDADIGSKDR